MSDRNWTNADGAAKQLGCSASHLSRMFWRTHGDSTDLVSISWRNRVCERAPADESAAGYKWMYRVPLVGDALQAAPAAPAKAHTTKRHSLLDLLPKPRPVAEVTLRQALTLLCNEVASATDTPHEDLWRELYEASRVFDGVDVRARSKNATKQGSKHASHLEYAENEGLIEGLYDRAHHIWGGRL
jgi:hypothetical protein